MSRRSRLSPLLIADRDARAGSARDFAKSRPVLRSVASIWFQCSSRAGLHLTINQIHERVADDFLADLRWAVGNHGESRGVEARYN